MCGIVGVVGNRNATDILIQCLQKLEYRGYDSSGIFVTDEHKHESIVKAVGQISALQKKIKVGMNGNIGIGHTRWATHGKPTENNAHPHVSESGRFVLVHNGVIENFQELKRDYLANNHFIGQTDTEVAIHLIGKFAEEENLPTKEAFKKALNLLEGSFAFAMIDKLDPITMFVAKNKAPLIIGLADGFNLIGSDVMAMIRETKEFIEIRDNEIAIIKKDSIEIFDKYDTKVKRTSYTTNLDLSDISKGAYPYYMLKEIEEQPAVIRRILQNFLVNDEYLINEEILKAVHEADRVYIIAAGTSYHAGFASKVFFEEMTHTPVEVCIASEFGYSTPLLSKKPLFIYISQSGETADSRQVLLKTKRLGYPALTITNVPESTLSREADYTLLLHAGPEIAVASTKAYIAQITVMLILAKAVGDCFGSKEAKAFNLAQELSLAAASITTTLSEKENIAVKVEKHLKNTRNSFYIGRGNDYYVAMEAALKLKEISYIQCEGFAAGELKHGTIALIEEGTPVQAIISSKATAVHTRGNLIEVISRGAKTLVIVSEDLTTDEDDIIVPTVHPYLIALTMVVPTQLIAYYATIQRGFDVDKPRNLAKSVTVE